MATKTKSPGQIKLSELRDFRCMKLKYTHTLRYIEKRLMSESVQNVAKSINLSNKHRVVSDCGAILAVNGAKCKDKFCFVARRFEITQSDINVNRYHFFCVDYPECSFWVCDEFKNFCNEKKIKVPRNVVLYFPVEIRS